MVARNHNKRWTKDQEEMLLNSYGETTLKTLASKLGRTQENVKAKYKRLTGSQSFLAASGKLTSPMIAEGLGVHRKTVTEWIRKYDLVANRYTDSTMSHILINDRDLWNWMKDNKERIDFTKCTLGVLVPEPLWYKEEVKLAKLTKIAKRKEWTMKEIQMGVEMRKEGLTNRQIAEKLNRSYDSVKHKMRVS